MPRESPARNRHKLSERQQAMLDRLMDDAPGIVMAGMPSGPGAGLSMAQTGAKAASKVAKGAISIIKSSEKATLPPWNTIQRRAVERLYRATNELDDLGRNMQPDFDVKAARMVVDKTTGALRGASEAFGSQEAAVEALSALRKAVSVFKSRVKIKAK